MLVPRRRQALGRPEVHVRLEVVVGQFELPLALPQGGALLHLQAVAAQVLRLQGQDFLHRGLPALHALARQAVDQVQGQVADLPPADGLHRRLRLGEGVDPADGPQLPVVGGLNPQGDPVDPRPAQGADRPFVRQTVRVGLQGDLRVLRHLVAVKHGFQYFLQPLHPQVGGGAAAKVHRVHRVGPAPGGQLLQLPDQGGHVPVHGSLRPRQGVEVAVDAFAFAEGDVDV